MSSFGSFDNGWPINRWTLKHVVEFTCSVSMARGCATVEIDCTNPRRVPEYVSFTKWLEAQGATPVSLEDLASRIADAIMEKCGLLPDGSLLVRVSSTGGVHALATVEVWRTAR